jgi:hypothetical protein
MFLGLKIMVLKKLSSLKMRLGIKSSNHLQSSIFKPKNFEALHADMHYKRPLSLIFLFGLYGFLALWIILYYFKGFKYPIPYQEEHQVSHTLDDEILALKSRIHNLEEKFYQYFSSHLNKISKNDDKLSMIHHRNGSSLWANRAYALMKLTPYEARLNWNQLSSEEKKNYMPYLTEDFWEHLFEQDRYVASLPSSQTIHGPPIKRTKKHEILTTPSRVATEGTPMDFHLDPLVQNH